MAANTVATRCGDACLQLLFSWSGLLLHTASAVCQLQLLALVLSRRWTLLCKAMYALLTATQMPGAVGANASAQIAGYAAEPAVSQVQDFTYTNVYVYR